ncbi:MAG: hypothetical protein ACR2KI_05105 [Candidatus Limnocylindria bacterium]
MANACAQCRIKLGFGRRLTGATLCGDCEGKAKKSRETLSALIRSALADEIITAAEELSLTDTARSIGVDQNQMNQIVSEFNDQFMVARVNDGRMPVVDDPPIILKRGETAHLVLNAELLKEIVQREFRGGSRGVSFPIGAGIRYRVGSFSGHSVVTGTKVQAVDSGTLTITSQRAVYTGQRKTLDMPYAKLEAVKVFTDGVQFHMSNRQNPPLFRVRSGPLAAAIVNGAAERAQQGN